MAERLSSIDVSFLYLEGPTTPMQVGGLAVFRQSEPGFDYETLMRVISNRISRVPRYRQKVRAVPGHLASPVWVDDIDFDLAYHVRLSVLPRPGTDEQLNELVGRIQSRPLDRTRPLWEMYLVEGLAADRFAIISKTHSAIVDGISSIDIAQVILDIAPAMHKLPEQRWTPQPEPSSAELIVAAVSELVRRPTAVLDTVRIALADARSVTGRVNAGLNGLIAVARVAARPAPGSPLNVNIGARRRFSTLRTDLEDYRRVRKVGDHTVNDVVLATVAGALRGWLLSRAESVRASSVVRALVPMSVHGATDSTPPGNRVTSYLLDLPVGEPNPLVRLAQVSYAMRAHQESGQSVGADALIALSGFAPPTLHALGARAASSFTRRLFNLVITNVPGPQFPLYVAGAQLLEIFPIVPLASGQALAIGLTSYDGGVYFGLNGDRDAMYDLGVFAAMLEESLAELVQAGVEKGRRK